MPRQKAKKSGKPVPFPQKNLLFFAFFI